jgi:hypothetical protein
MTQIAREQLGYDTPPLPLPTPTTRVENISKSNLSLNLAAVSTGNPESPYFIGPPYANHSNGDKDKLAATSLRQLQAFLDFLHSGRVVSNLVASQDSKSHFPTRLRR